MGCNCKEQAAKIEQLEAEKRLQKQKTEHTQSLQESHNRMHKELVQAQAHVKMLTDAIYQQRESFQKAQGIMCKAIDHWVTDKAPELQALGLSPQKASEFFEGLPNTWPQIG